MGRVLILVAALVATTGKTVCTTPQVNSDKSYRVQGHVLQVSTDIMILRATL